MLFDFLYSNFAAPGNDVMTSIWSLLLETLIYGLVIILFVTLFILSSIAFFSADYPVKTDIYDKSIREYYGLNVWYVFHSYLFIDETAFHWLESRPVVHRASFPEYFTKRAESMLDICFLVFPTIVVILILLPTLGFLYSHEFFAEHISTAMSIDVIGHQWYWSYEYRLNHDSDLCDLSFDSILDVDAVENANLEVDRRVVIPTDTYISVTITSTDVIHSWALPQLGIKVDAIPGRIANAVLYTFLDGVYYGQCSELCGVLHGFMPICVESVPLDLFFCWVFLNQDIFAENGVDFTAPPKPDYVPFKRGFDTTAKIFETTTHTEEVKHTIFEDNNTKVDNVTEGSDSIVAAAGSGDNGAKEDDCLSSGRSEQDATWTLSGRSHILYNSLAAGRPADLSWLSFGGCSNNNGCCNSDGKEVARLLEEIVNNGGFLDIFKNKAFWDCSMQSFGFRGTKFLAGMILEIIENHYKNESNKSK